MRYTRNRQLNKAYKTNEFTGDKNFPMKEYQKHSFGLFLDESFKWHREYGKDYLPRGQNFISYGNVVRLVKF